MTTRDYENVAYTIKAEIISGGDKGTLSHLVYNLADKYRREDEDFQWRKFLEDAGIVE